MVDRVRIAAVAASLPPKVRSSCEVEALVAEANSGFRLRKGLVESMSGIRSRRVASDGVQCSDLAADAARTALAESGLACNSFLNGIQIAEAMILSGACETAVVATGEVCSRAICWRVKGFADFRQNFPGYTMGDAGAAAVLTRSDDARGIFFRKFLTVSRHWDLATIPCGGSMNPRGEEHTYLMVDGPRLKDAFLDLGKFFLREIMSEANVTFDDFSRVLVHQATVPYMHEMIEMTGIPLALIEHTVADFGNMASASLPVAYTLAAERGDIGPGDRVLLLGLASGISVGAMMVNV